MAQPVPGVWEGTRNHKYAEMWTCGRNDHGQCGVGTMADKSREFFVPSDVEQIPLYHPEERKVIEWCPFSSILTPVQSGGCGSMHSIFLSQETIPSHVETKSRKKVGTLHATGSNNTGQLGLNNKYDQMEPVLVDGLFHSEREVLDIQCGAKHNLVIARGYQSTQTEIWSWGQGWFGRLGHGTERFQLKPKMIASIRSISISMVSCGGNSSCALTSDGKVYTWGYNKHGQCGIEDVDDKPGEGTCNNGITRPTPAKVPTRYPIISISMGHEHTIVLDSNGTLFATGSNEHGQLGIGGKIGDENCRRFAFTEVEMSSISSVKQVSCGGHHTLAINQNGKVYAWGRIEKGRCGTGRWVKEDISTPLAISYLADEDIHKVIAGDAHSFAITTKKRVYAWGLNKYGQLGFLSEIIDDDKETFEFKPRKLEHIRGVDNIYVGGNCAAGFSFFQIGELKYLLFQHIRDFHLAAIQRLLAIHTIRLTDVDEEGRTPLHWACHLGAKSIVILLLKHSSVAKFINLPCKDSVRNTALHICAEKGYIDCAIALLQADASTQVVNENKQTAVHLAARQGHFGIASSIIARADALGFPTPILMKDNNNKSPLQSCSFENSYVLKNSTTEYFDVTLVFAVDQAILGEKLASFLESKKIKCWFNRGAQHSTTDVLEMVRKSRGIIFLVGTSSVQEGSSEIEILLGAKEQKMNLSIFPIWQEMIELEADMEAVLFRYQLIDFSDNSKFTLQGNVLAAAIKNSLMKEESNEPKESAVDLAEQSNVIDTNADSIQTSLEEPLYEQTLFLSYSSNDAAIAQTLLSYFDLQQDIQLFDSATADPSTISRAAKHCFAVLVLLSETAVHDLTMIDQISVAENNKKPLFAIQIKDCDIPIAFQYTLAITPIFVYHPANPEESVNQVIKAIRLRYNVDRKTEQYRHLLKEVKRAENLHAFARAHRLDAISIQF